MANDLTIFNGGAVPAHVANFFDSEESNIVGRSTVNSLSPSGKNWTISVDGNKTVLQRRNADGDLEPLTTIKVIVLDYNKRRGRAYYEGAYDPENVSVPICWSEDGIAPDASLPAPGTKVEPGASVRQALRCDKCPRAVKGSRITDSGKSVTACSQHRMLAVLPEKLIGRVPPLRLKIAITSDFDKQSPEQAAQGWYAFGNYMDHLISQGVKHSAALVTKMKFDTNAAYPKIFFAADRWLDEEELAEIAPVVKSEEVQSLLAGTWTPAGADGVRKDEVETEEEVATTGQHLVVEETKAPVVEEDDGDDEIILGTPEPSVEKPAAKPKAAKPKAAKPAAETAPAVSKEVPQELNDLLAEWGD